MVLLHQSPSRSRLRTRLPILPPQPRPTKGGTTPRTNPRNGLRGNAPHHRGLRLRSNGRILRRHNLRVEQRTNNRTIRLLRRTIHPLRPPTSLHDLHDGIPPHIPHRIPKIPLHDHPLRHDVCRRNGHLRAHLHDTDILPIHTERRRFGSRGAFAPLHHPHGLRRHRERRRPLDHGPLLALVHLWRGVDHHRRGAHAQRRRRHLDRKRLRLLDPHRRGGRLFRTSLLLSRPRRRHAKTPRTHDRLSHRVHNVRSSIRSDDRASHREQRLPKRQPGRHSEDPARHAARADPGGDLGRVGQLCEGFGWRDAEAGY